MKYKNIVCIDDCLRKEWWPAKNFFYDLIREPIKQATDFDIKSSPRFGDSYHNLRKDFSCQKFEELCFEKFNHWQFFYCKIPKKAEEYLLDYIDKDFLIISYEMPKYLKEVVNKAGAYFLDIRISPLRFASDLYIAIQTNDPHLEQRIKNFEIKYEEIQLEASLVKASVRHLRRYSPHNYEYNDSIIFLGQTPDDASLISCENNRFISLEDFSQKIESILNSEFNKNCRLLYKPHPSAPPDHLEKEIMLLRRNTGKDVQLCRENIYILLGSDDKCKFMGISSSALQEATFFDKESYILYKPICDLREYTQIRFNDFISPYFWKHVLYSPKKLKLNKYPYNYPSMLRHLHNVWWGYSEYLIKDKHFYAEIFRAFGFFEEISMLNKKIHQIEEQLNRLEYYEREYFNILNSNSWRITKPLREIKRFTMKLRDKFSTFIRKHRN